MCALYALHVALAILLRTTCPGQRHGLTHINYDITHGHLEVWSQVTNTTNANSDSSDDKARKANEDT